MGRILVVVAVLVAIALLVNKYILKEGDPAPPGHFSESGAESEAPADANASSESVSGDTAAETAAEAASEDEEAPELERTPVSTPVAIPAEVEEKVEAVFDTAKIKAAVAAAAQADPEPVLLGSPELTSGIPGSGDLTFAELEAWLADPKNHVVIEPELPLGLAAGAGEIQGIDINPLTRAKIELGRQLYFDTRLSSDNTISCASCHDPVFGYAANTRFGVGVAGQEGNRNSPVAYNRIVSGAQFWDGRAASLEDQAVGPIANAIEMGNTHEACVGTLKEIPGYVAQFEAIFADGLSIENVGRAIASFERAIVTGPAPWDYYQELKVFEEAYAIDLEDLEALAEEDPELLADYQKMKADAEANPLSESAARGGELFFSDKAGCTACHVGANFADEKYHNLGVGMEAAEPDLGRFVVTSAEIDRGAFKTPTVRNVAQTAPYMHDGSQLTLEEVVDWYVKGGHPNPWLSEKVKKLELTDQERADLVAFMRDGLTGPLPQVETGRLP
jgi:cytochrome c peroxidase